MTAIPDASDFNRRLLAEAMRRYEDTQGRAEDSHAAALARVTAGDLEHRIMARAQLMPLAPRLVTALQQITAATRLVIIIGLVFAVLTGATAIRLALGPDGDETINFFLLM